MSFAGEFNSAVCQARRTSRREKQQIAQLIPYIVPVYVHVLAIIFHPSRHINQNLLYYVHLDRRGGGKFEKTYVIVRRLLGQIRWTRLGATAKWPASVDRRCDVEESPFSSLTLCGIIIWIGNDRLLLYMRSPSLYICQTITKHKQQRTITELSITLRV